MGIIGRASSGLRIAGALLVSAAIAACAVAYGLFVVEQRQYFTGRNFRLLSTLATQFDGTLTSEARVIASLATDPTARFSVDQTGDQSAVAGEESKTLTSRWVKLRQGRYPAGDIQFEPVTPAQNATAVYAFEPGPDSRLRVHLRPQGNAADPPIFARLRMERILRPLFAARMAQGAFDTIVLATQEGEVLYAGGRRVHELRSSGLAALLRTGAERGAQPRPFAELARTTAVDDVSIAGVDYKLFIQPCCVPTLAGGKPLILAGLVESDVLTSQSWAISTTFVKLAVMAMLVVLIGWPFLKLSLIGDRQKVRVSDLFQLGASSVAGLAIVTIMLLDVCAYWQLNRDTDRHLKVFAESIDRNATAEVADAYRQLTCLEGRTSSSSPRTVESVLANSSFGCRADTPSWPYPFFETFSLIDATGMQKVKLATASWVPSPIDVNERPYFKQAVSGRGWQHASMCPAPARCAFESVWSWTTAEPLAVLAKRRGASDLPVAAISIPMRSLVRPVLPPGFEFAVIDRAGRVLFHSDRQRNVSENFFEETDDNRRLRAQVAAHSAEPVNIRYWGAAYRAYVKPMALPDAYVVAMAQKQRGWAINREWLVVALLFLSGYLILWFVAALATLPSGSSWIWPDPARRASYYGVTTLCLLLLGVAAAAVWDYDRNSLVFWGAVLPLAGWVGTRILLRRRPAAVLVPSREPVAAYSVAAVLLLIVSGVVPGALLFLASFHLHAQSYIKNSQLLIARALSERFDRLSEEYSDAGGNRKAPAWTEVNLVKDRDLYFDTLYDTCVSEGGNTSVDRCSATANAHAGTPDGHPKAEGGHSDFILALLEDYLPYYSEASVEWRELLHDRSDDAAWASQAGPDGRLTLAVARGGSGPVVLTSRIPTLMGSTGIVPSAPNGATRVPEAGAGAVPTSGRLQATGHPAGARDRGWMLMVLALVLGLVALTWGVVRVFLRYVFLVGVTEPLWSSVRLALNAGDNIFVLCDEGTKARQIAGTVPLRLGPIARERDVRAAWRKALIGLDRRNPRGGAVLVDDFDEDLDQTSTLDSKLALLEELVADPSRTVVLLSQLSPTGLSDSLRHVGRHEKSETPAPESRGDGPDERWRRVLKLFVFVEWRDIENQMQGAPATAVVQGTSVPPVTPKETDITPALITAAPLQWSSRAAGTFEALRMAPVRALLDSEGRSHPYVSRICADLRESEAVQKGLLTREQAFDEIAERAAQCYRNIWTSCSEDEKVVLNHVAQHGLANASVRTVVRRLLGRRLLCKDPALRPMNETFRRFVLSNECWSQVTVLETAGGPSAWDRVRVPLAVGVVGVGVFLFATQKELYNAILGVTTAAAISVPTLIRAIGLLAGRQSNDGEGAKT